MRAVAMIALVLGGCTDTTRIRDVAPDVLLFLDETPPAVAYVPGTLIDIPVSWAARCETTGPRPDTGTTSNCDEQEFQARVTCTGGACEIDPPAAASGIKLDGSGMISVTAVAPGDLTIEVTLEHLGTHEQFVQRGRMAVRDLERVVIDCQYQAYDPTAMPRCADKGNYVECTDFPWTPCGGTAKVDAQWGTPVSIWVYGEGGGYPMSPQTDYTALAKPLAPDVTFTGDVMPGPSDYMQTGGHADPRASSVAVTFGEYTKTAGRLDVSASIGGLAATTTMQLVTP